jgi:hypothetical protein
MRWESGSVDEQQVSDIESGQLFCGRDPLGQFGQLEPEVNRKAPLPFTTLHHGHPGDDHSQRGLAELRM